MHFAEVDQSGKFEATGQHTALALANGVRFTLLIPSTVKRDCMRELRKRSVHGPAMYTKLFATSLYFLLYPHIERVTLVTIDTEYQGRNAQIKQHLLHLLRRNDHKVDTAQIAFGFVGKHSPTHHAALAVFRGTARPDLILTVDNLLAKF